MSDLRGYAKHYSHTLREFVGSWRARWTDQAAYVIYQRYLNPHSSDDDNMHIAYSLQDRALRDAEQACGRAKEQRLLAEKASLEVEESLHDTREKMRNAGNYRIQAINDEKIVILQIQQVMNLLALANGIDSSHMRGSYHEYA